jgi:hypothetical protein
MKLNFEIVEVLEITDLLKKEMFSIMEEHYANVHWGDFLSDLSEKHWVILLFSEEKKLVGFSTQLILLPEANSGFKDCIVLFSGDTIIAHEYWGSLALPVAFLQLVSMIQKSHPGKTVYWMLITKGLRTYKFLSVFLKDYYPCHFAATPPLIQELMKNMGKRKFGSAYNIEKGIIEAGEKSQYLKKTFQPETKKKNEVAEFFYTCNPGYSKGDELLCFAEISNLNLHPFIQRVVKNYV